MGLFGLLRLLWALVQIVHSSLRRSVPLQLQLLKPWSWSLQECARDRAVTKSSVAAQPLAIWSLWSMQRLIHAWFQFVEKEGTEVAASSANVPFSHLQCKYSGKFRRTDKQRLKVWVVYTVKPWEEADFR